MDVGIIQHIDAMARKLQEAQRSETARARQGVATSRSTASAIPELREEVEAVNQQVVSYERLNALIAERIKLEAQAASTVSTARTVSRRTGAVGIPATATAAEVGVSSGTSLDVWLAEQRAMRDAAAKQVASEQHRMGQRQRWTTTSPEAQATASAVQSVQSAPGQIAAEAEAKAAQAARAEIEALAQLAAEEKAAATAAEQFAVAQGQSREAMLKSAMAMAELDDSMGRSGALSTAAIQGMAAGTITIRELGNQVAETVGKFGLWAGAAAAVYGVLGALGAVKTGAVDVSSSVTALGRFLPAGQYNANSARESIVQQGRATATPLSDVGSTAQSFARAFKNQGDVFTATHVALTAAKLDTISLADSYKYLTAIVQESGAKVSSLPAIFDQLTAAQDKLGARMSVMLPAFSGSVGAVQSMGGDPSQLIGLEALTAKRTGFDGSVIGNMYRQGAARYFNTAAGRSARVTSGIDPNLGFTQALIEALQKAPGMTGTERNVLGNGFFGTRFGPRAAPLFRSTPEQVKQALAETAPGANAGLANKQLGNAMSQANNQLALLKVNLEAIGAELTGSKMTSPFSALLGIVNELLKATGDLVHIWDELPGPVKSVGSDLAVAVGLMATARRFNIGGMMANSDSKIVQTLGIPLQKNPEKILAEKVDAGMGAVSTEISSRLAQAQTAQMRSSMDLSVAQQQMAAADQSTEAGLLEYKAATKRAEIAADTLAEAQVSAARYVEMGSLENQAVMRTQMTAIAATGSATGAKVIGPGGVPMIVGGGTAAAEGTGVLAGEGAVASEAVVAETGMMATSMAAVTAGMSTLAHNAIPAVIAALIGFDMIKGSVSASQQREDQGIKQATNATTVAGVQAGVDRYLHGQMLHIPLVGNVSIPFLGGGDPQAAAQMLKLGMGSIHANQAASQASDDLLRSQVNPDERSGNYTGALKALRGDRALQSSNPQQYQKSLDYLTTKSEGKITAPTKGQDPFAVWEQASQDLLQQLGPMMQSTANAAKVFGTTSGALNSLAAGYMYAVQKFGDNPQNTQAMQVLAQAQTDLVGAMTKQVQDLLDLGGMSTTNKGQSGDYQQALGDISKTQSELKSGENSALKLAGADPAKRTAVEDAYKSTLGLIAKNRRTAITDLLDQYSSQTDVAVSQVGGVGPASDLQRAEVQLQGYSSQLGSARHMGADASTVNELLAKVNQQAVTVLQDRISYYQQLSQAETSYAQSGTADPIQQQQIAQQQLGALYSKLVAAGDKDKTQLLTLLGQQRSAGLQVVASQISQEQAQSQAGLSKADIGQPQQVQLGKAVGAAQSQLGYLLALPKNEVNPTTLISAYNNLYQAQGALAQFVIQQGESMIGAEAALKAGQTFDPVAIAAAALAGAKQLLAYDTQHNMPAAQLKQDAAGVASDMKSKSQAQWQKSEATTQFLAQTYQITGATEIQRLQALMVTMKKAHASYQDIQQVAQQVWNLEYGSGNLNLNTGNIKLPSTYQVKSAIMGGRLANRRATTAGLMADVQTNVHMTVNVSRDADIRKVSDAMSKALGTSVSGLAKAAGLV